MENDLVTPVAIIQARMGSHRLPGKVLLPILGHPMLWHIVNRVRHVPGLAAVVVGTSDQASDEPIRSFCQEERIDCFAGSEEDVLDRFYQAAVRFHGDPLIRITGDCPLVDPDLVTRLLKRYSEGPYDHVGIATGAGAIMMKGGRYPDGLDAECFSFAALEKAWKEASRPDDREHVTSYIWRNTQLFRCGCLAGDADYSQLRWTVDNQADFDLVTRVYEALSKEDRPFLMADVIALLAQHPEWAALNKDFIGKEGYKALWNASPST